MTKKSRGIPRRGYLSIKDMQDNKLQSSKYKSFEPSYLKEQITVSMDGEELYKVKLSKDNKHTSRVLDNESNKRVKGRRRSIGKAPAKGRRGIYPRKKPIEPEEAEPYDTVPGKLIRKRNK